MRGLYPAGIACCPVRGTQTGSSSAGVETLTWFRILRLHFPSWSLPVQYMLALMQSGLGAPELSLADWTQALYFLQIEAFAL